MSNDLVRGHLRGAFIDRGYGRQEGGLCITRIEDGQVIEYVRFIPNSELRPEGHFEVLMGLSGVLMPSPEDME